MQIMRHTVKDDYLDIIEQVSNRMKNINNQIDYVRKKTEDLFEMKSELEKICIQINALAKLDQMIIRKNTILSNDYALDFYRLVLVFNHLLDNISQFDRFENKQQLKDFLFEKLRCLREKLEEIFSLKQTNESLSKRLNMRTCIRPTYDRSTSAYSSKQRTHHQASILSRVARQLDQNEIDLRNNRKHLLISYRHWRSQNNCRSNARRLSRRYRKIHLPVCYQNFPLSLIAQQQQNMKQTKTSVDIRKISCDDSSVWIDTKSKEIANFHFEQKESKDEYDDSILYDVLEQSSNSSLLSAKILRKEDRSFSRNDMQILIPDELASNALYQIPSKATVVSHIKPACIWISSDGAAEISMVQLESFSSVLSEFESQNYSQYSAPLNTINDDDDDDDDDEIHTVHHQETLLTDTVKESNEKLNSNEKCEEKSSSTDIVSKPSVLIDDTMLEKKSSKTYDQDEEEVMVDDLKKNSTLIVEEDPKFDSDFHSNQRTENSDAQTILKIASKPSLDRSVQNIIATVNSESDEIKSIRNHIGHELIFERKDHDTYHSDSNSQLQNFDEISSRSNPTFNNIKFDKMLSNSNETEKRLSTNQNLSDKSNSTSATSIRRENRSNEMIDQQSNSLLSTVIASDEDSISTPSKSISQRSVNKTSSDTKKYSNANRTDIVSLKSSPSIQSKSNSSNLKHPPLMTIFSKNTDIHSSCRSSEQLSYETDQTKKSSSKTNLLNEKSKLSRIMTIPRKSIEDSDLSFSNKQKKDSIKNAHSTRSLYTKPTIRTKCITKRKLLQKSHFCKSILHRSPPIPCKPLKDPCRILNFYSQFKCLQSPSILPSLIIKNAHICNVYLLENQ